jgi:hypothetical protein
MVVIKEDLCVALLIEDGSHITDIHYGALLGSLIEERIPFKFKHNVLRVVLGLFKFKLSGGDADGEWLDVEHRMAIWVRILGTHRIPDPTGTGTGMIFYSLVSPVPDLKRDDYEAGIFTHPR